MNNFTKGEWLNQNREVYQVECSGVSICRLTPRDLAGIDATDKFNGDLIATAGTTATKLAEQGYDAVKVLELLPQLVYSIQIRDWYSIIVILEQCRGDV